MLDSKIIKKLNSLLDLPAIPAILSEVLESVDDMDLSSKQLAKIIEKDQSLTAKILKVANSPYYGYSRRISTIDLAILILGVNSIKEIVLSLVIKRFVKNKHPELLDVDEFWNYSIYCGSASKFLARKLDYRIAGEAFVAGLMHDIGFLIILWYFTEEFKQIRAYQLKKNCSLIDAEKAVLNATHAEIGAWLAEKWQLPHQLCSAIREHHDKYNKPSIDSFDSDNIDSDNIDSENIDSDNIDSDNIDSENIDSDNIMGINKPLTVIVAMAEWFAGKAGLKNWTLEKEISNLFFDEELINKISGFTIINKDSSFEKLRVEILNEYEKALETHGI